jgi:hypothetical protein
MMWKGCGGDLSLPHVVEPKTYYSRNDGLMVHFRVKRIYTQANGTTAEIPDGIVSFKQGRLITDDPEVQLYLETKHTDLLSKGQYEDLHVTEAVRTARLRTKVDEQAALLDKQNAELARLRAQKQEQPKESDDEKPEDPEPAIVVGRGARRRN